MHKTIPKDIINAYLSLQDGPTSKVRFIRAHGAQALNRLLDIGVVRVISGQVMLHGYTT